MMEQTEETNIKIPEGVKPGLSRQAIKYLAVIAMTLNHIAVGLLSEGVLKTVMENIGYFTAVVMCFFLAEGFRYTSSKKRYGLRLFLFGLISQVPYIMAFGVQRLNIMFSLLIGFLLLLVRTEPRCEGKRLPYGLLLVSLSGACDWPVLAPVFTLLFYNTARDREEFKKACAFVVILNLIFTFVSTCGTVYPDPFEALLRSIASTIGPAAACLTLLYLYNGKESTGKKHPVWGKWFFYIYYPAHLLIIGLIRLALFT